MHFSIKNFIILALSIQTAFAAYQLKYTLNQNNGGHISSVDKLSSVNVRIGSSKINYLASTSNQYSEIRIWDSQNGVLKYVFNSSNGGHTKRVSALLGLQNGFLVSGSADESVKVWDLTNGSLRYTFNSSIGGHSAAIYSLAELENGYLASGSYNDEIRVWDINFGKLKYSFFVSSNVNSRSNYINNLIELDDGYMAATSTSFQSIFVYDITIGRLKYTFNSQNGGHTKVVNSLAKLPNGNLVSAGQDTIKIWDIVFGKLLYSFPSTTTSSFLAKLIVINSGYVASISENSQDYSLRIWDMEQRSLKFDLNSTNGGHTGIVRSLINLENGFLATGSNDDTIKIWNPTTGRLNYTFDRSNGGHRFPINALASLNNGYLASGSEDFTIKIWYVR